MFDKTSPSSFASHTPEMCHFQEGTFIYPFRITPEDLYIYFTTSLLHSIVARGAHSREGFYNTMNPPIRYLPRKFILFAYMLLLGENSDSRPVSSNTQVPLGRQRTSLSHNNAAAAAASRHSRDHFTFISVHQSRTDLCI